jgi:multiple antibiotic resistance protein
VRLQPFFESFLPLFVALDALGVLPIFLALTGGYSSGERRRLAFQATATALFIALLILFAGQLLFGILGITVNDLRVGGGLVLLVLSISSLLFPESARRPPQEGEETSLGIVPIGIPLIMGPAAITTVLISRQSFGYLPTLSSLALNMTFVYLVLAAGPWIQRFVGTSISTAAGKVLSLYHAAISVAMIRAGVMGMFEAVKP